MKWVGVRHLLPQLLPLGGGRLSQLQLLLQAPTNWVRMSQGGEEGGVMVVHIKGEQFGEILGEEGWKVGVRQTGMLSGLR